MGRQAKLHLHLMAGVVARPAGTGFDAGLRVHGASEAWWHVTGLKFCKEGEVRRRGRKPGDWRGRATL